MDWDIAGRILATTLSVCAVLGILYKYVVLPNLRTEFAPNKVLAEQLTEVHRELKVNHHSTQPPTVKDDLSDMQGMLVQALANQVTMLGELRVYGEKFRTHEDWSTAEVRSVWAAIDLIKADGRGDK